jgi:hypothetical protein
MLTTTILRHDGLGMGAVSTSRSSTANSRRACPLHVHPTQRALAGMADDSGPLLDASTNAATCAGLDVVPTRHDLGSEAANSPPVSKGNHLRSNANSDLMLPPGRARCQLRSSD